MKLSLAMIVKNEAAHLGRCLDSVRGLVDEMIVVDTGSTDGTGDLARERGALVSPFTWTEDFSAARNAALARATGDWVLVLDADEALEAPDHARVRAACAGEGGYRVLIRSYLPDGAHTLMDTQARANPGPGGQGFSHCGETRAVRLFRRHPWVAFRGRIHEMVDPCFLERGLGLPELDAVIHHYGFTLPDRVETKKPLYLELARRDALDRPRDPQSLFHLLIQAAAAGDWELALATAEAYRAQGAGLPPTVSLTHATALQRLGRHEEALAVFAELPPGNLPARVGRGVSLERLGRGAQALELFEACIREHPDFATTYLDLADLHARAGDGAAAREVLGRGLGASPSDPALWARLVRLGLEGGDTEGAVRDAWGAIQACPRGGEGAWHKLVGLFLLRNGAAEEGREVIALGREAFPGDPDFARLMATF